MIKGLRRKFVLIVMLVVTLILLAIFFTMLATTQRNNERISTAMLRQAFNVRMASREMAPPPMEKGGFFFHGNVSGMRLPVLLIELRNDGSVYVITNQLHFITESDITEIAEFFADKHEESGVLKSFGLRYLERGDERGVRIALADISIEQEMLKTQIMYSLLIGAAAMLTFFLLSLVLARWAVRPVELAWERQKQFVANASHELKTPLTVILSNAEMLRNGTLEDEKNIMRIEHIQEEAVRMKLLVEDMLMLARSDIREKSNLRCLVDFSYIVKSAVLMYEPIAFDDEKKLLYNISDNLHTMGDSQRLQQIMHILLDNALKYSRSGGVINVGLEKAERGTLLLSVENDGEPIPADELERIFLRFYRRDEARSESGSFGLGLSIAQGIVNAHKGRIWAESNGRSSNVFYVSLPRAEP